MTQKFGDKFLILAIISLFIFSIGFVQHRVPNVKMNEPQQHGLSVTNDDLTGIRIALYESYSSFTDPRVRESRTALFNMLTWMNASVEIINRTDIELGALWAFEILVIPEGLGPFIESNLRASGREAIRQWVKAGGSYVGVRGSSSIAVTEGYFEGKHETFDLGLINGTSIGMPEYGYIEVSKLLINRACTGPNLSDMPDEVHALFRTGRYFVPNPGQEIICIANYSYNNQPAMIASHFGLGNVFISSPHFEYEENSDRDGTDYMDDYNDNDSEWPLVMEIIKWQIEDSPIVVNTTTWGISTTISTSPNESLSIPLGMVLVGTSVGVLFVVYAGVVLIRKNRV
ncbi:MAG: hypothetical protein BAJATHORv1_30479 [Candidatus Thorarchaeota archaeon]|nr:MAG: hypothetical protein BAJATHORv1_30479 [Candidatus Thorarchaeota archaeon]